MAPPESNGFTPEDTERLCLALKASNEGIWDWWAGKPEIYYSRYSEDYLDTLAATLARTGGWCIFDNTADGEATANALGLLERLGDPERRSGPLAAGTSEERREAA